jgi:hypothetical protein
MTLATRLVIVMATSLAALFFVGSLGLWRLHQAEQRSEYVEVNIIPSISELYDAKAEIIDFGRLDYRHLLRTDSEAALKSEVQHPDSYKVL